MKPFWKSRTLWLNALVLLDGGSAFVTGHPSLLTSLGLSATQQAAALAVANAILRMISTSGISSGLAPEHGDHQ